MSVPALIAQITWTSDVPSQKAVWENNVSLLTQIFDLMASGDTLFLNQDYEPSIEDWYALQESPISPSQDLVWFSDSVYQSTYRIINNTLMLYDTIGGVGKSVFQSTNETNGGLTVTNIGRVATNIIPSGLFSWPPQSRCFMTITPIYVSDRPFVCCLNMYSIASQSVSNSTDYALQLLNNTSTMLAVRRDGGYAHFVAWGVTPGSAYKASVLGNISVPRLMAHSILGIKVNFAHTMPDIQIAISSIGAPEGGGFTTKTSTPAMGTSYGYCTQDNPATDSNIHLVKRAETYIELYEDWS